MTSKSVFADPLPGDRSARRLIVEINRNIDIFLNEHEDAIRSRNPRLIRQANQTRQDLKLAMNFVQWEMSRTH